MLNIIISQVIAHHRSRVGYKSIPKINGHNVSSPSKRKRSLARRLSSNLALLPKVLHDKFINQPMKFLSILVGEGLWQTVQVFG